MIFGRPTRLAILFGAALALVAPPALSQEGAEETRTGSRFTREKCDGTRIACESLGFFGRCVAGYKSDKIESFLLDPSPENWEPVIYSPNNRTRCAIRNMAASFREYSGTVAEGWYVRRFENGPPDFFTTGVQTPPTQDELVERLLAVDEADRDYAMVLEFARCVAATAPVEIDALLRTDVESKEERAAVSAIAPHLGPCAFEGEKLSFDYESLRSMLAFALATRAVQLLHGSK